MKNFGRILCCGWLLVVNHPGAPSRIAQLFVTELECNNKLVALRESGMDLDAACMTKDHVNIFALKKDGASGTVPGGTVPTEQKK
jgi:hypothetical protein